MSTRTSEVLVESDKLVLKGGCENAVQIGTKTHDFSDPTGLMSDCHRRIEMFLGSLHGITQVIDSPLTTDARNALETAPRYFHANNVTLALRYSF